VLFTDDIHAQLDAFIADEDRRSRNQLADFVLTLSAKGAVKSVLGIAVTGLAHTNMVPCWGVVSGSILCRRESLTEAIEQ
jgi:hypothetical protein